MMIPRKIIVPILMFLFRRTKCSGICDSYGICTKCSLEIETAALIHEDDYSEDIDGEVD